MTGCDSCLEDVGRICEELRSDNKFLRAKVNDLEGRSRWLNLKFVGINEGAEQGHPITFITELIATLFGQDKFPKPVKVDRAHRLLRPKPSEDERPRPIIAKLHHDRDKELILRLSHENALLHYIGKTIAYLYGLHSGGGLEMTRIWISAETALLLSSFSCKIASYAQGLHLCV